MNMTPEEMNTQLYEKLTAEQAKYRDWLMGQPPEEILNHAYEYAVREALSRRRWTASGVPNGWRNM